MTKDEIDTAVDKFAMALKYKLYCNMHKGHWGTTDPAQLLKRLLEECNELIDAVQKGEDTVGEAVDVAAMAMMVADVTDGLPDMNKLFTLHGKWSDHVTKKLLKKIDNNI